MPKTWAGRSRFDYTGSVETGTDIVYGKGWKVRVDAEQFKALRRHFLNRVVPVGTSRTDPPEGSRSCLQGALDGKIRSCPMAEPLDCSHCINVKPPCYRSQCFHLEESSHEKDDHYFVFRCPFPRRLFSG